ncbi:MAG TPA: hypothetical protein VHK69_10860 [Chitinophagaceae bacterium]|jgi:hypothetical protein|nr:hypothetical protein [Chitinophagaceae bacterium]
MDNPAIKHDGSASPAGITCKGSGTVGRSQPAHDLCSSYDCAGGKRQSLRFLPDKASLQRKARVTTAGTATYLCTLLLFCCALFPAFGQDGGTETVLVARSKAGLFYVLLTPSGGMAYKLGRYWDKGGTGYSLAHSDTLTRQPGASGVLYLGKNRNITSNGGSLYLVVPGGPAAGYKLDTASGAAFIPLNNAYYLGRFFALCDTLNRSYPVLRYSYRHGYASWNTLDRQAIHPAAFRDRADRRLQALGDSIRRTQDRYTALTGPLMRTIGSIAYPELKDSLSLLGEGPTADGYYGAVVRAVSLQRPEFFFRLAEDHPDRKDVIFNAADNSRAVLAGLRAAEGRPDLRKEFFKSKRFEKSIPFRVIGTYAAFAGWITFLIVRQ